MSRIELLYVEDCPGCEPLLARVRELLAERGIDAPIELVRVDSHEEALQRGFAGSPSVRVDGVDVDVERGAGDYGLTCRLRLPDDASIRAALAL